MRLVPIFKALNHLKCPNPNLAQRTGKTLSSSQESQLGTLGFGTTAWCTAHWDSLEESRKRTSCMIRTNFWSIVLDDHWSKTIYRPNMIVRSGVISHPSMILFFEDGRKMNISFAFLITEYLLLWSPNIWCSDLYNSLWAVRTNFKVWMFIICILHSWQISPYLYSDGAGP